MIIGNVYEFIWLHKKCINQDINRSQKAVALGIQESINRIIIKEFFDWENGAFYASMFFKGQK